MKDVLGQALSDYYQQFKGRRLWVHNKYGPKEKMPVHVYFREPDEMPELEWMALQQCKGSILDIGAGAGSHSLCLQKMGLDITALDISPKAAEVMRLRGVQKALCQDFFALEGDTYDTLLLLMNGIGLSGTLAGLRQFLAQARRLLRPGGRLIFDSSDIAYLYDGKIPDMEGYYGEILYQYEYRKEWSDWFNWLFIDQALLKEISASEGWSVRILLEDPFDQYLAVLQIA